MWPTSLFVRLSIFYILSLKFFCVSQEPERSPDYDVISDEFLRQNRDALLQLTTPQDTDEGDASWAKQDVDIPGSTVESRILPEDLQSHTEDESTTMLTALDVVEEMVLTENATVIVVNVTVRPFWDAVLSTFAERNHEVFDPITTPLPTEMDGTSSTADHHSSTTEEAEKNIDIEDDYADDSVTGSTPPTGSTVAAIFLPDGNLSIVTDSRNLTLSIVPVVVVLEDETSTVTTESSPNTTSEATTTTENVSATEVAHVANSTMGIDVENDILADAVGVTSVDLDLNSTVNVSWSNQDRLDDSADLTTTANSSSSNETETFSTEIPENRSSTPLYITPCARCEFDTTIPSWMPTTTEEDHDRAHPAQIFAHVIHAYSMIIFGLAIIFLVVLCCFYASFCQRVVKRRRNDANDKAGANKGSDDALLTQI